MLVKRETTGPNPSLTLPPATACVNCGAEERRLLHHVRHRGIFRRLCTTCVLRLHPQSFCPTCFQVYPPAPSPEAVATCIKCYSSSHSQCIRPSGAVSLPTPFVCSLCEHPNTPIFKLKSAKEANVCEPTDANLENCRVMDRDSAKKLLAAAKIASMSMNKAAAKAKAEAERRVKEAAYTRKRAKEALEYVAHLVMKEKLRKKEAGLAGPSGGPRSFASRGAVTMRMDRENSNVSVITSMDSSGNILAVLNGVGPKDNNNMRGGVSGQGVGPGLRVAADCVLTAVDDTGNDGEHVNFMNLECGLENVDVQAKQTEDVNDDDDDDDDEVLVQFVEDQIQHEENNHGGENHMNGMEL